MDLIFADDSKRSTVNRDGMGPLVAVGGVVVPDDSVSRLEESLKALCRQAGCPATEEFKWSLPPGHWMRDLSDVDRAQFYQNVLRLSSGFDVRAFVVVSDTSAMRATGADTHELDVTTMFLERVDAFLVARNVDGLLIMDEPSGGPQDQERFLVECMNLIETGTRYRSFRSLALAPLKSASHHTRLLQLADLVTSCTTQMVAGHEMYAGAPFQKILEMMDGEEGRRGGRGLKLHPDYTYTNHYHWLLGDTYAWRGGMVQLPSRNWPYFAGPNQRINPLPTV